MLETKQPAPEMHVRSLWKRRRARPQRMQAAALDKLLRLTHMLGVFWPQTGQALDFEACSMFLPRNLAPCRWSQADLAQIRKIGSGHKM